MATASLRTQIYLPSFAIINNSLNFPCLIPAIKVASPRTLPSKPLASSAPSSTQSVGFSVQKPSQFDTTRAIESGNTRFLIVGAVSVGVVLFLMAADSRPAWALGPEGPLVEEFWDNVRRYGLYALTVSTGALYTVFLPILELMKNPISAILVLAIFGGGIFIVSQVLSAMVGVSDFSYDYGY